MAGAAGKGQQFGKGSLMDVVGGWLNEMRYFYQRQVSVPLSPHAQALWCWLMYRANSVFWKFPLRLSVPEMAGCTKMSPAMVKKARAELVAAGEVENVPSATITIDQAAELIGKMQAKYGKKAS